MRWRKLPEDAFSFYHSLGSERRYRAVAEHYGVSKRAVTTRALREKWQERLRAIEDPSTHESLEEITARHLASCQLLKQRALEAMRRIGPEKVLAAARKLEARRRRRKAFSKRVPR